MNEGQEGGEKKKSDQLVDDGQQDAEVHDQQNGRDPKQELDRHQSDDPAEPSPLEIVEGFRAESPPRKGVRGED